MADGYEVKLLAAQCQYLGVPVPVFSPFSPLIIDDWGLEVLTRQQRTDLLEVIEDRNGNGSTVITSQLPTTHWHDVIGDPTLADAILDRLLHNAHKIQLKGESMRKKQTRVD